MQDQDQEQDQDSCCKVPGAGCRVQGVGCRMEKVGCWGAVVQDLRCRLIFFYMDPSNIVMIILF